MTRPPVFQKLQVAFNKHVYVSIHNGLDIARFHAGTMIFDQVIRMEHVRTNLAAPFNRLLGSRQFGT